MISWDNVAWIFQNDGSLRDIYIQDVTLDDWQKMIEFLNKNYSLTYGAGEDRDAKQIDLDSTLSYLIDESGEMESKSLSINIDGVLINCYFFLPNEMEFDLTPKEINSIEDYRKVESFMISISNLLGLPVILTGENEISLPLISIDTSKGMH